jgi:hypothetical protein
MFAGRISGLFFIITIVCFLQCLISPIILEQSNWQLHNEFWHCYFHNKPSYNFCVNYIQKGETCRY